MTDTIPQSILDLSKYPYFPSILAFQICPRCKHPGQLSQFWRNERWCKNCERCRRAGMTPNQIAARKRWNQSPVGRKMFQRKKRDFQQTPVGAEAHRKHNREYRKRHAEKIHAHKAVAIALKSSRLTRQPCQKCGATTAEAHHPDYAKPLDVIWLCEQHHKETHLSEEQANAAKRIEGQLS